MAKVTKDMLIGQLLALNPNIAAILMRARNALHWMPFLSDGISGRSRNGSWNGCRSSGSADQRFSGRIKQKRIMKEEQPGSCSSFALMIFYIWIRIRRILL